MSTGLDVFDTTLEKTNLLLGDIEEEFNWHGRRNQSYLALRCVLHALRDRLPTDDVTNFGAQLPILIKGIYYDGWKSETSPIKMNRSEFVQYVGSCFKFDVEGGPERVIRVVMEKVFNSIDPGEHAKIKQSLPEEISDLI